MAVPEAGVVAQFVVGAVAGAQQRDDAKGGEIGNRVGGQIEKDGGLSDFIRCNEADEQIASVRNARIRERIMVRLEIQHRRATGSEAPTTVPRIMVAAAITHTTGAQSALNGSNDERNTRANAANAAAFTPVDMKPVTIAGAPS